MICFQPHRRHVLSDPASCVSFLGEYGEGGTFEVALAPGSFLEPAMTPDLDDHLRRAFQTLGRTVSMVILHDLATLIGEGRLLPDLLRSLLREHVDPRTPVVLAEDDLDRQREWLAV